MDSKPKATELNGVNRSLITPIVVGARCKFSTTLMEWITHSWLLRQSQQQLGPVEVLGNFGGIDTPLMTSKLKENELNGANGSTIIQIGLGISLIM